MSVLIDNARALLRRFEAMDCRDLLIRDGDFTLFIARDDGVANPLLAAGPAEPVAVSAAPDHWIAAPHLGSFLSALPPGSAVDIGTVVAKLALLDEIVEVPADRAGTVAAVAAEEGALIEYGMPLLTLAAA